MRVNRNAWGSDERAEYDALIEQVVACSTNTGDRLDLFERLLNDAVQAQRPWARDVERLAIRHGLAKEIKAYQDRNRALVSHDGQVLNLPRVQSRRLISPGGEVFHQRELIETFTWEQIAEKRAEAMAGKRTYTAKIAHYDALLTLRDFAPNSATPAEAAEIIGTTVEQWLGGKAAA